MIDLKLDDKNLQRGLSLLLERSRNPSQAMRAIAATMLSAVEMNFRQEGRPKWKPMSALTRQSRGVGAKLLQRSAGGLAASIAMGSNTNQAWVGSNKPYAAFHQFGTKPYTIKAKNGKALKFAGKFRKQVKHPGLPARPFLQLTSVDKQDILDVIAHHLRNF